jgi:hypothetical protein
MIASNISQQLYIVKNHNQSVKCPKNLQVSKRFMILLNVYKHLLRFLKVCTPGDCFLAGCSSGAAKGLRAFSLSFACRIGYGLFLIDILLVHSVLTVILAFEVYGNRVTAISQSVGESSQKYHKWCSFSYAFMEMNRNNTEHNISDKVGSR